MDENPFESLNDTGDDEQVTSLKSSDDEGLDAYGTQELE